jgi:Holliday junction resolvase-like predicted endonuclease
MKREIEQALYLWNREKKSSTAEVDFVTTVGATIVLIEVKAGASRWLKSLRIFMEEKNIDLGIRISSLPLELDDKILSVPL